MGRARFIERVRRGQLRWHPFRAGRRRGVPFVRPWRNSAPPADALDRPDALALPLGVVCAIHNVHRRDPALFRAHDPHLRRHASVPLPYVKDAFILPEVLGSDHCPVGVELDPAIVG